MKCFKCLTPIGKSEHYFKFIEMKKQKKIAEDFCHKVCWDEVKSGLKVNVESMAMLRDMKEYLNKSGVMPDRVVQI